MHHINNNVLAVFAVLLIMLSMTGPFIVIKKADEMKGMNTVEKVTGRATATIKLSVIRPVSEVDFRAVLLDDNKTVMLAWNDLGIDNVSVYISNSPFSGFDISDPNVTGITALNWTDTNSSLVPHRYYRIGIWREGLVEFSNNTVGKFDIPIKYADGNPAAYELNQVSMPLVPHNISFSNIVRGATSGDIVLRFNTSDIGSNFEGWETNIKMGGGWIEQFDTMYPLEGYVFINVQNPYNLTIVGDVPEGTVTIPMKFASGSPTNYEMMLLGWNSLITDCNLSHALNTTTAPGIVTWFNTTDAGGIYEGWDTFLIIGSDWFPSDGCMRPGYGYRFLSVGTPYNWSYNRTG